jgi:hypothetical protein
MTTGRMRPRPWTELIDSDTGALAARVPLDSLLLPAVVTLEGSDLQFDWSRGLGAAPVAPSTLLDGFLQLSEGTDRAVASFAGRYGPLGIISDPTGFAPAARLVGRTIHERRIWREPVDQWRMCATELADLLGLVATIRAGSEMDQRSFESFFQRDVPIQLTVGRLGDVLTGKERTLREDWRSTSRKIRRESAVKFVQARLSWLAHGCSLRPALALSLPHGFDRASLTFQDGVADEFFGIGVSLLGALTLQVLSTVTRRAITTCSECGRFYVPSRSPGEGRRRFCPTCGKKASLRQAAERYRKKRRAAVPN